MFTVFRGGQSGAWRVKRLAAVKGESLAPTPALSVTVAGVDDCCRGWYRRDLDHLALQRAARLAKEYDLMP